MRPVVCSVCKKMYKSALTDVYDFFIAGFRHVIRLALRGQPQMGIQSSYRVNYLLQI